MKDASNLRELAKVLFPEGRQAYAERLDDIVNRVDVGGGIDRAAKPWWKNAS